MTNEEMIECLRECEETLKRVAGKKFSNYPNTRYNGELIEVNYYIGKVRRHLEPASE